MELIILGYNSALPTAHKHSSSQLLKLKDSYYLFDCGEGTQRQLRKAKVKFSKINHIFISHLHGDHVFGLIGLVNTFNLLGREKTLHIYGPVGIRELIENQIKITQSYLNYELDFRELSDSESVLVYEDKKVEIHTIPLQHRVYCNGYLVKEKQGLRNLNMLEIEKYPEIERCDYYKLKQGYDFVSSTGEIVDNELLTSMNHEPTSYAYLSDTTYLKDLPSILQGTDVLYHESTFLSQDHELAVKTGHSTAKEAGQVAEKIKAKVLILGHFSNRYNDYTEFQIEAQQQTKAKVILPEELHPYYFTEIVEKTTYL